MPAKRRRASKKSNKKTAPQDEEGWYTIRRILDEKVVNGRVQYLVDWDDNSVTGEKYTPTWSDEVTPSARDEWELQKASQAHPDFQGPQQQGASAGDSDTIRPPSSGDWRQPSCSHPLTLTRKRSTSVSSSGSGRPLKLQRRHRGKTASEEPGLEFASRASTCTASEIHDLSYQETTDVPQVTAVVDIAKLSNFDPAEYPSVTNSQPTSQSIAELETQDSRIVLLPPSQQTISDSQEPSDLSWSHLHAPSTPASATRPEKAQRQPSQPSSPDTREIPDSLEQTDSGEPSSSPDPHRQTDLISSVQGLEPRRSQKNPVPQVETEQSDISLHHRDRQGAAINAKGEESEVVICTESVADSISRQSASAERVIRGPTEPTTRLKYPVQPSIPPSFSAPSSSTSDQRVGSLQEPGPEIASLREEEAQFSIIPKSSQDAQIGLGVLDSVEHPLTDLDANGSNYESLTDQSASLNTLHRQSPPLFQSQPSFSALRRDLSAALNETFPPSAPQAPFSARSRNMDSAGSAEASSHHRVSAVEELSRLFGLEPEPEPEPEPKTAPESPDEMSETEPSHSTFESVAQIQAQAEIPIHSSLSLDNPPFDGASTPWPEGSMGRTRESISESVVPSTVVSQSSLSATEALLRMVDMSFVPSSPQQTADAPPHSQGEEMQQATVSLADITRQIELDQSNISSMPSLTSPELSSARLNQSAPGPPELAQAPSENGSASSPTPDEQVASEYTVTLPFHASLRPSYDSILVEYKRPISSFSNAFTNEIYIEPEEALVNKIDELFVRLHNLCDYPQDVPGTSLEELPPKDIAKYCCDANPKFSFVSELLQNLHADIKILIIARSTELLRLLHHLTDSLQVDSVCEALGKSQSRHEESTVRVTLALPSEDVSSSDFDAVIGFDSSFTSSLFARRSFTGNSETRRPLSIILVTTHSIEHIAHQISEEGEGLTPMERKNVILAAIVRARKLLIDPDRDYLEPFEVASVFCEYLNGQAGTIPWEPQIVPDDVLDVFLSSQARSQIPRPPPQEQENGRKRKLDTSEDPEVKRMRTLTAVESEGVANQPPLPDEVRKLLESASLKQRSSRPEVLVRVSLSLLEVLAEQVSEYDRRIKEVDLETQYQATISGLEKQIKEHERMVRTIYASNRAALQDRSMFEAEAQKAEAAQKAAVEAAEKETESLRKKMAGLEERVTRLTQDTTSSDPQDTPLAKSEKLLEEALAKIVVLEKRLENANQDGSYSRHAYQEASGAVTSMRAEIDDIKAQNEELAKRASDNLVRIHQIQKQNSEANLQQQIQVLTAQLSDRDSELDRTREELRQLKNGRRETRGVSVPRSPRMGVMSPRINRGYGSASRGTSPAAGVALEGTSLQFIGAQPSNPRWNHLRD